jgi:hypothetical protein
VANMAAANTPVVQPVPVALPLTTPAQADPNKVSKDLAMSNYTHQINLAAQGLASAMRES